MWTFYKVLVLIGETEDYKNQKAYIRVLDGGLSLPFSVERDVRQGCLLSPVLYIL